MIPRPLLAIFVVAFLLTACGGDGDDAEDGAAEASVSTPAAQSSSSNQGSTSGNADAEGELTEDYLQGEWCAVQENDTTGTRYVFEGNSFEYGRGESLGSGGNIPTFLIGIKVVSVEDDQFTATKFGREITFTRGQCS